MIQNHKNQEERQASSEKPNLS